MGKRKGEQEALPKVKLDLDALPAQEKRTRMVTLRVTPTEYRELRKAARRFRTTVSAYLLGLHGQAMEQLSRGKGGR